MNSNPNGTSDLLGIQSLKQLIPNSLNRSHRGLPGLRSCTRFCIAGWRTCLDVRQHRISKLWRPDVGVRAPAHAYDTIKVSTCNTCIYYIHT